MGQPILVRARVPRAECIGRAGGTGGTETSQYPEEEESTGGPVSDHRPEIPGVVASETGAAQTGGAGGDFSVGGVVGPDRTVLRGGRRVEVNQLCQPKPLGSGAADGERPVGDGDWLGGFGP